MVRHQGRSFRPAPLSAHVAYLERDGSPGMREGLLLGATQDRTDAMAFARRGLNDRHHFRFIVTPEDAAEMTDLRAFTRDLVGQMESDLGTGLDGWHRPLEHRQSRLHPVVRGVADDGSDPQVRHLAGGRLQKLERMGLATAKGRANE